MPQLTLPTAAELRGSIDLDHPTREDLDRVHAAMGATGMAISRIKATAQQAGRSTLLASEQREVDQHTAEIGHLAALAGELEARLPMDPADRKLRFGSTRFPAAAEVDYTRLQRLSREHSVLDWYRAQGGPADYDADAGWEAFTRGLIADDWRAWTSDFGPKAQLAMSTSEPGGGYLVPDLMSARIIDRLRSATPVFDAGAQLVPMTASTLDIPRITGDPTAAWHAESAAITPSDATVDRVRFTAKTLPFIVKVSRELQEDAPGLGQAVQMAIRGAAMVELTRAALRGDGTANSPTGIRNQSGVTLFAIGANGGAVTLDMLIDRVTDVRSANAVPNALIWAPRTAGGVAKLAKDSQGNYFPLPSPLAELAKFQTTAIPINISKGTGTTLTELYFGDFTQLLIGMRMQLGIELLRERYADTGEYAFNAWMRCDIQLEHGPAFSVITDSTT